MTQFYTGMADFFASLNNRPAQNLIINPQFDRWQKATSYAVTTSLAFGGPDRWAANQNTSAQCTISQAAPSPALPRFKNCCKVLLTGTSANLISLATAFETIDCTQWQGKDVVISFRAVKGSTWNPTFTNVRLFTGTGTDQATTSIGGWTGSTTVVDSNVTHTTAWGRSEVTCTIPSTATQIGLVISFTPTGAGVDANSYLMITDVRIEAGSKASDFDFRDVDRDFERCRRHLRVEAFRIPATTAVSERINMRAVPTITGGGAGYTSTGTTADAIVHFQTAGAVATLTLNAEL
jgi:hypothetical protein